MLNIQARKFRLKLLLLLLGTAIALTTIFYFNYLTDRIEREERAKAKLWAQAIGRKARLVKYTKELFDKLSRDQRQKVDVFARSLSLLLTVEDQESLNFINQIVTSNTDIPVILTDEQNQILSSRNVDGSEIITGTTLSGNLLREFSKYPPIQVRFADQVNVIYYKDSNLFSRLKSNLNDLIETFISEVVINTVAAPVVLLDNNGQVLAFSQIDSSVVKHPAKLSALLSDMQQVHQPVVFDLGDGEKRQMFFDDSAILKMLRFAPYVQILIFIFFTGIAYLAFSYARKAEQNSVWVGMAKETAHQLGTPISSLTSWMEYIKESKMYPGNETIFDELQKDVNRLTLVAERFSKIGSAPQLQSVLLEEVVSPMIDYMKRRSSEKVVYQFIEIKAPHRVFINTQLFDWVLENLLKNALDAMQGEGRITITAGELAGMIFIDVQDSGKGIPASQFQTIFEPGFSTKTRGWGLGLSLTKRIITDYHQGKIFVKNSVIGKGTTFRILLNKG